MIPTGFREKIKPHHSNTVQKNRIFPKTIVRIDQHPSNID